MPAGLALVRMQRVRQLSRSRLLSLLRLLGVVLVLQLSGSAPAIANVVRSATAWLRADAACPCCAAMAKQRRADLAAARVTKTALCFAPDCCESNLNCADCPGDCLSSPSGRDARSLASNLQKLVPRALATERVAAPVLDYASPLPPDLPSIYRPPCA